jgi:hypothetical protein
VITSWRDPAERTPFREVERDVGIRRQMSRSSEDLGQHPSIDGERPAEAPERTTGRSTGIAVVRAAAARFMNSAVPVGTKRLQAGSLGKARQTGNQFKQPLGCG